MKTKHIIAILLIIAAIYQSCDLTKEEYNKITPENFYQTQTDAQLAVAAIYNRLHGIFGTNEESITIINNIAAGDMMRGVAGTYWDGLLEHEWSENRGHYSDFLFPYYKYITTARIIAKEIESMSIPDNAKLPLLAETKALAGWLAYILYDFYGPVPYPTDEMIANPKELAYPAKPSNEEFVKIIENFFKEKDYLRNPDHGGNFGRMDKGIANTILMKLYMLEGSRTENSDFYNKAKILGEEIISSGWYKLEEDYSSIFSISNQQNKEIIYARPEDYSFNGNGWHAHNLPNNLPCPVNDRSGAWAVYKLLWSFYDTFNQNDLRLKTIISEYTTYDGIIVNRENPLDNRHGLGTGCIAKKYDFDPGQVGWISGHDMIIYRYADILLSMAEILNELGTTSRVNAPITNQKTIDGIVLTSDGGNTAFSYINAIRVRSGLTPLPTNLSKEQLRDSILMERGHELYAEGTRRTDLIRYQRVTKGQGYKIFDLDPNKFLMPIPVRFIDEYQGHLKQNPGY